MTATTTEPLGTQEVTGVTSRASAWLAIGAAVLALVLAPPRGGDLLAPGVLGVVVEGRMEQLVEGTWRLASAGDLVPVDAEVRVLDSGVSIRTRDGAVSLAGASHATLGRDAIDLRSGAVLVEGERPTSVLSPGVTSRGRGVWRVDATASPRVGVYSGGVAVADSAGNDVSVGAYQQVDVVERVLSSGAVALRYLSSDPWDVRLLAGAMAVDRQVTRLEASLERTYGTELQTVAFYADFVAVDSILADALPGLARLRDGDRFGPPAETLTAVVVASLLTERAGLTNRTATDEIRAARRAGATWGLVLASHDLGPDRFREAADAALRRRQENVADGTAAPAIAPVAPDEALVPDEGTGDGDPTPPDDDPTPPGGGTEDPSDPPDEPNPPDGSDPVDDLENAVDETVDDVTDLLEPIPGVSEGTEDVGDTLDETVDESDGDLGDGLGGTLEPLAP